MNQVVVLRGLFVEVAKIKKGVVSLLLALCFVGAHAQHFEWVKGYESQTEGSIVQGAVSDAEGNLYILGQIHGEARWNGERLLPNGMANNYSVLIAKIAPSGEMVWKKVISSNNNTNHLPYDIKKVGDTAFACLVEVNIPTESNYTYYLDTLLSGRCDYPIEGRGLMIPTCTAVITFDFDGNVEEQHFLWVSYTDTAGNDIVRYHDTVPWYGNDYYRRPSFDIDADGNIYISREAEDYYNQEYSVGAGTIKGIKYWVDKRQVGYYAIENQPLSWYQQLMKFSPHFDTLLACRYVVQQSDSIGYSNSCTSLNVDADGNVYFMCRQEVNFRANTMVLDSLRGLEFSYTDKSSMISYLVQYDSNLNANWKITLDDSVTNPSGVVSSTQFCDLAFDYDSNLMFLSASTARTTYMDTTNYYSVLTYLGEPLDLKTDAFFVAFRMNGSNPPALHSYGRFPSPYRSSLASFSKGNLVAKDNRVFMQCSYSGAALFPGQTIWFDYLYTHGMCLTVFDYQGNVIKGIDYSTSSLDNRCGSIVLVDSLLYLSGVLAVNATFGDITPDRCGKYAYVAKYVDTAFMSPHITLPQTAVDTPLTGALNLYPNPAHDILYVGGLVDPVVSASLISALGIRENLSINEGILDVSRKQPGIYILEIITINHKYYQKIIKQ